MANIGKFHNAMDGTRQSQSHIDAIEATLALNGGWSKVDSIDSPGGMPCGVWKCSGAANNFGTDWYLLIARTTNNPTQFSMACAESYDPGQKKFSRPVPGSGQSSTAPALDTSYGGASQYSPWSGTTGSTLNTVDFLWRSLAYAAPFQGLVVVTKQSCTVTSYTDVNTQAVMHFGVVEQLFSPNQKSLASSSWGDGRVSRHPKVAAATAENWKCTGQSAVWTLRSGGVNMYGDRFFDGAPVGSRVPALVGTSGNASAYGHLYGLYRDTLNFKSLDVTIPGEVITVGAQTYITGGQTTGWYRTDID